jgi:Protein of unknown function (DUF1501)
MLDFWGPAPRPLNRRELMLRVGGLSLAGLALPSLLNRPAFAADPVKPTNKAKSFGKAKNCILLYLSGAPSQLDTFDPKPDAPDDIRGEFGTIATSVPGVRFSELLPLSATHMERIALVRTMTHDHNDHGRGSYWMFTGVPYNGSVSDVNSMSRADMPHMGSCVAKLNPGKGPMFPFVIVPHRMDVAGGRRSGQFAGALGAKYDPLLTGGNPNDDDYHMDQLPLGANESPEVLQRRMSLLDQLSRQTHDLGDAAMSQAIRDNQAQAIDVLSSEAVRKAVDLRGEKPEVRERYGRNLFGQSVLLGRRLLDAGARLVQCNWQRVQGKNGFAWDTHWNNFSAHKEDLVPPFDKAFHALMTDLAQTGQLDETLVVVAAEFGRSPKITRSNSGREHWPACYSVLFAGGGVQGGQVYGQSDKIAGYPVTTPTTPADFIATIYHCLGVDPHAETHDAGGRPFLLSKGDPIGPVVGI